MAFNFNELLEEELNKSKAQESKCDFDPHPKSAVREPIQPTQQARVKTLAQESSATQSNFSDSERGDRIIERIRKCFARGQHPNTPEAEAKASLKMAAKLMAQFNISYAQAAPKSDIGDDLAVLGITGDSSVVEIIHVDGKQVKRQAFVGFLAEAISIFFDCKAVLPLDQIHSISSSTAFLTTPLLQRWRLR
ncbi:hypothetical protein B0J14DRAFT_572202 [Halenospora varia]|nr:hypothetical protein B0J14DRAFT_572202 [Halenospora varia]